MTEKNKPMTFEEWYRSTPISMPPTLKETWNAARLNMIPADRAIEVPDVGEWPEDAEGLAVCFMFEHEWENQVDWSRIKYIPRPVPTWVPDVGDAVFVNHPQKIRIDCYGVIPVCKVKEILNGYYELEAIPNIAWNVESLKPFDPEKIGLPFDQI